MQSANEIQKCIICTESIDIFGIGECNHQNICWKCIMQMRLKLGKLECPVCKQVNNRIYLIKSSNILTNQIKEDCIFDNMHNIYFEDQHIKRFILHRIENYCQICQNQYTKKFPTSASLLEHYKNSHGAKLCYLCLQFKPILIFEQKLYNGESIQEHNYTTHPKCQYCHQMKFYDNDQLNKHYSSTHEFCTICKKKGIMKIAKGSKTSQLEYEVFRDTDELYNHNKKEHYVCDKGDFNCQMLVFEDSAQVSQHYIQQHNEIRQVRLEFQQSDDESEEEEKKILNAEITKENYQDMFPTLHSQNTKRRVNLDRKEAWPGLNGSNIIPKRSMHQIQNQQRQPQIQQKQPQKSKKPKQFFQQHEESKQEKQLKKNERIVERQVQQSDRGFEYREENDKIKVQVQQQNYKKNNKKKKMIIESQEKKDEDGDIFYECKQNEEEIVIKKQEDWSQSNNNKRNKKDKQQNFNIKNQNQFPELIQEPPPKYKQEQKPPDTQIQVKKKKKKQKGVAIELNKLEEVDYSKNFF